MQKILRKRLMDLHRMHSGEILNRLTTDVANVSDFYIHLSGQMCLTVFTSLFATIYLFLLNWKMAILFLIVIPLLTFLISVFTPKLNSWLFQILIDITLIYLYNLIKIRHIYILPNFDWI